MINKKLYLLFGLVLGLGVFVSCEDTEDYIDVAWIKFNDSLFLAHNDSLIEKGGEYTRTTCFTKDGDIFWKRSTDIKPTEVPEKEAKFVLDMGNRPKVSADGNPTSNDTVVVRYMGWYYVKNTDGELRRVEFDGTENQFNKQQGVSFTVNQMVSGFSTMLQLMDIKNLNQVQVAIPHILAYGPNGDYDTYTQTQKVPGYTTLYFNIFLQEIKPVNPKEFPDVDLGGLK